jgi:hypothetical protein
MTAKTITAEDRERLDGKVARNLQKGACSRDELLAEISSRLVRATRPASSEPAIAA